MKEPILVTRSSMPPFEEYCDEIKCLWESHWLTNSGVKYKELQEALEEKLGVRHVSLYTNGHLALENVIAAMDFPKGGEVITTPFTFASTTNAIVRNGLVPVFCDVKPDDYTLDETKIEGLITDKTVAIVPVHVYGNLCAVDEIAEIARKHSLKVIYDAAHAFGVERNGVSAGRFGNASMFSFHATKVYNTIEGGAVCFSDDALVPRLDSLKNFGLVNGGEDGAYFGGNAKMNEFQAAMGLCNLRHLEKEIGKRKKAVEEYRGLLGNVPGIKLTAEQNGVSSNYAYFPVVFDGYKYDRNEVFERLKAKNVFARKYFYPLTNSFSSFKEQPFGKEETPVAAYFADRVLTLPLYADLSESDVERICKIILQ